MSFYEELPALDPASSPSVKTEIPGPLSRKMLEEQKKYETSTVTYPGAFPFAIKRARDSLIEDADGNVFIDWVSGISVLNMGFSNIVRDAVKKQMDLTWHALEIPTDARLNFLRELRNTFPNNMQDYKTVFGISGSDACETAISLAHSIRNRRASTIAFEGAYHGVSGGIISATSGNKYKKSFYGNGFETVRVPYPYTVWQDLNENVIFDQLERIMKDPEAGYDRPDSVIVEPVQGEGGYIVPPDGFLKHIRQFCDENDLTMIVDEVQTGVGRTGKPWAFEWENIKPDVVCLSKSVGGGIPISAVYYRGDYDDKLPTPFHMGTFRANPLAMAAGAELLKEVPKVLDRVNNLGGRLKKAFTEIESDHIRDVRGKGFMIGVELEDQGKPMDSKKVTEVKHSLLKNGLMMHTCGHYSNVFRYMGALNIPERLNEKGLEIFESVVKSH